VADDTEQDEKTEEASQRRLERAWEEGDVALARDVVTVGGLTAGVLSLLAIGAPLRDALVRAVVEAAGALPSTPLRALAGHAALPTVLALVVCATAAVGGIVAALVQTRGGLWMKLAAPNPQRLFSVKKLFRIFTMEFVVDLGLSLLKTSVVAWAIITALKADFDALPRVMSRSDRDLLDAVFAPLSGATAKILTALTLIAGIDFAVSSQRHRKKMRMTKEETRREHKEDEGEPLLKARRRRRHRELAKGRVAVEVPRADALVVNPVHVAVAIRYRKDEGKAPRVTAKGKGEMARHMREIARSHGVPIVENVALARLLHRRVKVGKEIPADTYKAVAAVLAFVYRITGKAPGGTAA